MSDNVPQDGTFNEVTDLGVDFFDLLINYPYIKRNTTYNRSMGSSFIRPRDSLFNEKMYGFCLVM